MSTRTRWMYFLGMVLLMPSLVCGQVSIGQASISGTIKDSSGAILPGVSVAAESPALIEGTRSTITDENGRYRILDVRPGSYTVTLSLPGFSDVKQRLELTGSFAAVVDAEMRVGSVQE